ncbi:MAG: hypothetical protein QM733_08715 [Ilumatobacteraceae bacterium]
MVLPPRFGPVTTMIRSSPAVTLGAGFQAGEVVTLHALAEQRRLWLPARTPAAVTCDEAAG